LGAWRADDTVLNGRVLGCYSTAVSALNWIDRVWWRWQV